MEDKPLHIVTGASGGVGQALTERLAKQGYRVLMACRNRKNRNRSSRASASGQQPGNLAAAAGSGLAGFDRPLRRRTESAGTKNRRPTEQRRNDERHVRSDGRRLRTNRRRQLRRNGRADARPAAADAPRQPHRKYAVVHLPDRPSRRPTARTRSGALRSFPSTALRNWPCCYSRSNCASGSPARASAFSQPIRASSTQT